MLHDHIFEEALYDPVTQDIVVHRDFPPLHLSPKLEDLWGLNWFTRKGCDKCASQSQLNTSIMNDRSQFSLQVFSTAFMWFQLDGKSLARYKLWVRLDPALLLWRKGNIIQTSFSRLVMISFIMSLIGSRSVMQNDFIFK